MSISRLSRAVAILALLACCHLNGQGSWGYTFMDQPWMASAVKPPQGSSWTDNRYPTNITGYPVAAYYEGGPGGAPVQGIMNTSANTLTNWTDLYTNHWNLTNNIAGKAPITNAQNARYTVKLNGSSNFLIQSNVNVAAPFEIAMVVKWNDMTNGVARYFWTGTNNGINYAQQSGSGLNRANYGAGAVSGGAVITNKFFVMNWVSANGANSANIVYTNNVQDFNNIVGNNALVGFVLGAQFDGGGGCSPIEVGEVIIYRTNLTTTIRETLFEYFTNKYAFSF